MVESIIIIITETASYDITVNNMSATVIVGTGGKIPRCINSISIITTETVAKDQALMRYILGCLCAVSAVVLLIVMVVIPIILFRRRKRKSKQ